MLHFSVQAEGKHLGRPRKTLDRSSIAALRRTGASWAEISAHLGIAWQGYGLPRPSEPSQKLFQKDLLGQINARTYSEKFMPACGRQAAEEGLEVRSERWVASLGFR